MYSVGSRNTYLASYQCQTAGPDCPVCPHTLIHLYTGHGLHQSTARVWLRLPRRGRDGASQLVPDAEGEDWNCPGLESCLTITIRLGELGRNTE